ncbi:MAG: FHA domain-containing protein [Propionicimonas sp.]
MAKPHKYAWNGIDVETTLTFEQVANMAHRSAQECTGDLMHGKHRIASTRSAERQIEFRVNDFLITFKKFMVFHLNFELRDGRTWMSSQIDWYITTQPTVGGFIPVASKTMIGHNTYMQFVRHLAAQVKAADSQSRVTIREGAASATAAPTSPAPDMRAATSAAQEVAAPPVLSTIAVPRVSLPAMAALPPLPPPMVRVPGLVPPPPPPPPPTPRPDAVTVAPIPTATPVVPGGPSGLVTSVPGMPRREPPQERPAEYVPTGYASLAEQLFAEDESLFHTRMVQQSDAALPWFARLHDGQLLPLATATVLGRNPAAPSGSDAKPIPVDDPNRSVSKTHALLELRQGLPWVTDLHSTNGTTLTNEVGEAVVCEPGTPVPVGDGWQVGLGEYSLAIVRRAAG